ncbi:hypothetical protein LOAG_18458 [Loa loa]|uniref:Lzipper-MIP1 domain-containing protein n=1 Tax=Loa loa TaxID=7209 RepID=A0A1I7W1T6_LOALO|nr:hypothetical protein LOAG_18458 [Loa loa]EJD74189.1 hypothetical protein LOAG_18458 [Loa loa]
MADLQKRLQALRQQLDDSIRLYYCQQQQQTAMNRTSNGGRSVASGSMKNRRILHLLHQDETDACIQISGNMAKKAFTIATVTKIPNNDAVFEEVDSVANSTISPLQVIVSSGNQQQHPVPETVINFMAGFNSPVGSIDSGMSSLSSSNSSPASSPGCSPISVNNVPFHYVVEQQVIPRGRSTSECLSATVGLKGILKKSIPLNITTGRFLRSCSECQSRENEEMKMVIADMNYENSAGSTPRKKHVSFSERLVQERSFRPNSSILSQKKKNQRKQRNKMKKKGGSPLEDNSTDDEARHRSNSETMHYAICNNNMEDEMDPIECDLAACVLEDHVVIEQGRKADCHEAKKIHKHILRIGSD